MHQSYSVFKKLKRAFRKSIVLTLIFLFVISPLEPVFAANSDSVSDSIVSAPASENNLPASSYSGISDNTATDPVISAPGIAPVGQIDSPSIIDDPLQQNAINLAEPKNNDKTNDPSDKNKKKDPDGLQAQALSATVAGSSANSSSSSIEQNKLPKSDSVSGALTYEYPIVSPPGRNGMEPNLNLSYNSHAGEEGGIVGYGWSLNIPYIERINRKGTDKLYTENYFNSSLSGELVLISGTSYGSKVDNGEFLKYEFSNNAWLVTDKKGTKYKFGYSTASRQDDPADAARAYKWMIEEIHDTNDNFVRYEYFKDAGQIYPSRIIYTGNGVADGIFSVDFLREARTDIATSYRSGFSVRSNYRVNKIDTKINSVWTRKYVLSYVAGSNTTRSLLRSIVESGQNELGITTTLPATNFEYQTSNNNSWTRDLAWTAPVDLRDGVFLADVNGDSLMDIIQSYQNIDGFLFKGTYLNNGQGNWVLSSNFDPPVIFQYMNNDQGVRLTDVNGDGLMDLVQSMTDGRNETKGVYLNNGSGWSLYGIGIPVAFTDTSSYTDTAARIVDINGDGLPDLIQAYRGVYNPDIIYTYVYLYNGTYWALASGWSSPVDLREGMIIADANGDGLVDLLQSYRNPSGIIYQGTYLNNGKGSWIENTSLRPTILFDNSSGSKDDGVREADINGDGLIDLIQSDGAGGHNRKIINTGNGWLELSGGIPLQFSDGINNIDTGSRIADINGDGLPDLIQAYKSGTIYTFAYTNNNKKSDPLNKIIYSQGGNTSITYKPSAQYVNGGTLLNPNLPFVLDTVNSVTHNDGFGNSYSYSYQYEGGKYYYANAFDRKFAGFGKVTETDDAGHSVKTYYHQGDASNYSQGEHMDHPSKIGKPYRVEISDSYGNIYSTTINQWFNLGLAGGRDFVKLIQKTDISYYGASVHNEKAETYVYNDTNGNLIEKTEWGEVIAGDNGNFADTGSDKRVTSVYYASNTALNILATVSQEILWDQNWNKIKESKYYYDGLVLNAVSKGNLTKVEKWISGTDYASSQKSYNSYGLAIQEIDGRGNATNYTYNSYNLYPAIATNALNQQTQYIYDYSSGKPKQVTDPNGYVFQTVYDGLDRAIEEKQPDMVAPTTLVTKTVYVYTDTANAVSVKKTDYLDAANSVDSYSYFDGLGRIIQTRKEAEAANTYTVNDFVYHWKGLLEKESLAYFSIGASRTAPTVDSNLYISYNYDPLGRIYSKTTSVGTETTVYANWSYTTIDAKGVSKDFYLDAYNNLVRVNEYNGASAYITYYTYDLLGNLTKITDALGNIRNFTYNALGERLTAEDLHAPADATFGIWTYAYDANGNLISQTDPKNQIVNYTYDDLNRQLTEDYAGQAGTEKIYTYNTCTNGIGRLCSVATSDYAETKEYNALGTASKETKTISAVNYITQYVYDRQGNNILLINPDNSQVKNIYNSAGQLEQTQRKESTDADFVNVVTDFDYSPLGKITYQASANGAITTNTYDSTKLYRLSSKVTTISGGTKAQDIAYTFDANGNITKIIDNSATNSKKTTDYTYDSLNRLLTATATGAVNGQNYAETYSYDAIGNIINKNGQVYTYSQISKTNPDAVTSIGSTNYTYDDNGNLVSVGNLTNVWNYDNRLTQSVIGATTINYAYDAGGQRIKYATPSKTTIYPTKFYNTDGTAPIKHIFANGQSIATVKGTGATATVHSVATDHLTGSNVVTNNSGAIEELMDYYPYGDIRLDEKTGSFNEQRKYTGYEYDGDTGLNYAGARYYEAKIGRFISQDSLVMNAPEKVLQDPQALNSYAYARNNPLIYVDPTGNFFETAWDVGNVIYDAGRLVKNTVEVNVGLAKYGYGVLTKNQSLQNSALTQMSGDLGDLKSAGIDTAFDAGATMIPFVPAGMTKISNKVSDVVKISEKYKWGIPGKLLDHTERHGPDFGAKTSAEYARKAQEFKDYAIKNKIDSITTKNGAVKFYEETTNTLASFNPNGTTKTFFKPEPIKHRYPTNLDYWNAQKGGGR